MKWSPVAGNFRIIVRGVSDVEAAFKQKLALVDRASQQVVLQGGAAIQRGAREQFRGRPKGSKVKGSPRYLSKGSKTIKGVTHDFAPTPGKPTNRTGNLWKSIQVEATRVTPGTWASTTGPKAEYGRAVEMGNPRWKTGNKFPFLAPGYEAAKGKLPAIYRQIWAKALQ